MNAAWSRTVEEEMDGAGIGRDFHGIGKDAKDLPGVIFRPSVPGRWTIQTLPLRDYNVEVSLMPARIYAIAYG